MTLIELRKILDDAGNPKEHRLSKDQFLDAVKIIKDWHWERDPTPKIWISPTSYLHNPHDTPDTLMFYGTMLIQGDPE